MINYLHGKYIDAAELNGRIVFAPFLLHHCVLQIDHIVAIEVGNNLLEQRVGLFGTARARHTDTKLKEFRIDLLVVDAAQLLMALLHLAVELRDVQTRQTVLSANLVAIGGRCGHTFLVLSHADRVAPEEADRKAAPCVRNCKYQRQG